MLRKETIWRAKAEKYQNGLNEVLGDRVLDQFPQNDLRAKVEFALFGPPPYNNCSSETDKVVDKLVSHISAVSDNCGESIFLGYIFVYLRYKKSDVTDIQVLFRVLKDSKYLIVDLNCRTYKDWGDYLENNRLPKCDMCFPVGGRYRFEGFQVGFAESPACKISKSILRGLDVASSVVGISATGMTLAALALPITAPFVVGAAATAIATGAWDVGRGVNKLVDRKTHNQEIGLTNSESGKIWFDMATSTLGAVTVGGRAFVKGKSLVKIGQIAIETDAVACRLVKGVSVIISGVGMTNNLFTAINNFSQGVLNITDLEKFKSAFLFFFNEYLTIENTRTFIRLMATFIDLRAGFSFSSRNSSFSAVKNLCVHRGNVDFKRLLGMVTFTMKWVLSDVRLSRLDTIVNSMITTTYSMLRQQVSMKKGINDLTVAYEDLWSLVKEPIEKARRKVEVMFTRNLAARETCQSNPHCARELCLLSLDLFEYCEVEDPQDLFMTEIFRLFKKSIHPYINFITVNEMSKIAHFVCDNLKQKFDAEQLSYKTYLNAARQKDGADFDYDKFMKLHSIPEEVDLNCFFLSRAIIEFDRLNYSEIQRMLNTYNVDSDANVTTPILEANGTTHFLFRGPPEQWNLTENQYWQMARDLSGLDVHVDNASLHLEDNHAYIRPNDECENQHILVFYNRLLGNSVSGLFSVINVQIDT
ncbi:uncharacterized protein LOC111048844 [Nilaparvata lugens]|uniref:uncharacterized protein LOC111048844 n=1 Tax=Nilaparvata lugens TaxID=108931 RepID=UPI00193D1CF4|nr:uncharacterized protein LOC111048844 [Nilaparvata lugens]XP_022190519.2 uncharacterized protein LOC111048844 [Nilaparvata lugens]